MTTRNSTLVGVFNDRAQAENAIEQLHSAGIPDEQISYSGGSSAGGGFLAGIKSLFTGEDTAHTGLVGDLTGMGLSQDEANYYDSEYRAGRYIVAVNAGARQQDAQTILNSGGAYNYASRSGSRGAATTGYDTANAGYATTNTGYDTANAGYATTNTGYTTDQTTNTGYDTANTGYADTDEAQRVRLREERLSVDKQPVQAGEARLRKDVVEEQQNIDVPVNREEVIVQRQAYGEDRPTDLPVGQDETIRVPVSEEQVNVNKQTVETGEVGIGKKVVQDTQRVSDTVRREEAHLETNGNARVRDANANVDPNYNDPNNPNQGNY